MDSLKTLMEKKQYDLVIKLTDNSLDATSLFYRITAFIAVGQFQNALDTITNKREILKSKLALLIKFHIEILCLLGKFDEAFEELNRYEDLPYESQEVEEILRVMPNYIRNAEKDLYKRNDLSEEELYQRLLSKNDSEVLGALNEIKDLKLDKFLLPILKICKSYPKQIIRTYALLLLVSQKYDKVVEFQYFDELQKVVPSKLEEPFVIDGFKDVNDLSFALSNFYHDPSIVQNALQIISSYLLYIYPCSLEMKKDEIIIVFGYLTKRLLQVDDSDLEEVCLKNKLDYQQIFQKINTINEELKDF